MKPRSLILLMAFVGLFPISLASAALPGKPHHWELITYSEAALDGKACPKFRVGFGEKNRGLRVDILVFGNTAAPFDKGSITARVHRASGQTVDATLDRPMGIGIRPALQPNMTEWSMTVFFPWGTNTLSESWIEVPAGKEKYWLEIPYGFDRNPEDSLPFTNESGGPKVPAAMKPLTETDHIVPWSNVHYDVGEIQNGWSLSLLQSNPFDARSEIVLYREDSVVGKSMFLWDLHSPRTSLRLQGLESRKPQARCMSVRLHDDGMRRSDSFEIFRNGSGTKREWATLEIGVDEMTYRITVPTSVTSYTHGHARGKE